MKKLVTPAENSARYFAGVLLTGGHHYILISASDSYATRQIALGVVEVLAVDGKTVTLPDEAQSNTLEEIVKDYKESNPWDSQKENFIDYNKNAYLFAVEAYNSELQDPEGGDLEAEKPLSRAEKAALKAAEKAAAAEAKVAAEEAAAAVKAAEEADKVAAEEAAAAVKAAEDKAAE